jgi:photosystem II stability/assembly factor-like uncharacterized protein
MKRLVLTLLGMLLFAPVSFAQVEAPSWKYVSGLPSSRGGRYDDMDFVNDRIGWVVNLSGEIWHTEDGGETWNLQFTQGSSRFRSVSFMDELGPRGDQIGWAGTVFTAGSVLWETRDSGNHWVDITHRIDGVVPKGICGLVTVGKSTWGVGAFHGSPTIVRTHDGGIRWLGQDLSSIAGALVDVYFQNEQVGFAVGGSGSSLDGDAIVLRTEDGGSTWVKVFQSTRQDGITGEWGWKISFPSKMIGYVSVEYRANPNSNDAKILKTEDGGKTWRDMPVRGSTTNLGLQGLGFISPEIGWASGRGVTSLTTDGGESWQQLFNYNLDTGTGQLDGSMNRFIMVNDTLAYGVGRRLYRLSGFGAQSVAIESANLPRSFTLDTSFPNPFSESTTLRYTLEAPTSVSLRVIDLTGRMHKHFQATYQESGTHEFVWDGRNDSGQKLASGSYIFLIDIGSSIEMKQVVLLK